MKTEETPPILAHKHYSAASAFKPENLLREARRQKNLPEAPVPEICILDPDGDIVRYLCNAGSCRPFGSARMSCLLAALFHMVDGGNRRERQRLLKAGSYLSQRALPLVGMSW